MKKLRIVNKYKYYRFIFIILILIFSITFIFISKSIGAGYIENDFIEYSVMKEDTVWSIAEKYGSSKLEIRDFVDIIIDYNNLNNSEIVEDEIIKIPII